MSLKIPLPWLAACVLAGCGTTAPQSGQGASPGAGLTTQQFAALEDAIGGPLPQNPNSLLPKVLADAQVNARAVGKIVTAWSLRNDAGEALEEIMQKGGVKLAPPVLRRKDHPSGAYRGYSAYNLSATWLVLSGDTGCLIPKAVLPSAGPLGRLANGALNERATFGSIATSLGLGHPVVQTFTDFLDEDKQPLLMLGYVGQEVGLPFRIVSLDAKLGSGSDQVSVTAYALRMGATDLKEPAIIKLLEALTGASKLTPGKASSVGKATLVPLAGAKLKAAVIRYQGGRLGAVIYLGNWSTSYLAKS